MSIPNVWPGNQAKGVLRAVYNIAIARLKAQPPGNPRSVFSAGGRWVRFYGSKGDYGHYMRLEGAVANQMRQAAEEYGEDRTAFVALWPGHNRENELVVHVCSIPPTVVVEMNGKIGASAKGNQRNVRISKEDDKWLWRRTYGEAGEDGAIDVTAYHDEWTLAEDERQHVSDMEAPNEQSPKPKPPDPEPDPSDDVIGTNKILFGPPGTGKSRMVWDELRDHRKDGRTCIVTFHPEYTYADFVGVYKPLMVYGGNEQFVGPSGPLKQSGRPAVIYSFVAGPLARIIVQAMRDPDHHYYLVIEEINRGKCAAIFGDLFQILDRDINGESQYAIVAEADLMSFVASSVATESTPENSKQRLATEGLFLPANLSLYATMNTSDQSLYPMDSAMKRRWEMEYVPINYEAIADRKVMLPPPYGERVWSDVLKRLNKAIVEDTHCDDKQIGQWFVVGKLISQETFRDKVLSYLWFDVFRHKTEAMFDMESDACSYESLVKRYDDGKRVFRDGIL